MWFVAGVFYVDYGWIQVVLIFLQQELTETILLNVVLEMACLS